MIAVENEQETTGVSLRQASADASRELNVRSVGAGSAGWYCARTKPKNEHIAAANIRRSLGLEVFHPRLRSEQTTRAGVVRHIIEPLFPGYVFVHCVIEECLDAVRHTGGISSVVNFGSRIPSVPDAVIDELQECFGTEETLPMEAHPAPGDGVTLTSGAFFGLQAVVLRSWPAKRRVQILLDILGRPTPIEVDSRLVSLSRKTVAELVPALAAPAHVESWRGP